MKVVFLALAFSFFACRVWAQSGCTDPQAQNYDAGATANDGSCTYAATNETLSNGKDLQSTLNETSGLIYTDGNLWSMNDSGGAAAIYRVSETDGTVQQIVRIEGATNVDWEAITADANYMYIGDFGNNTNGNRTNLRIYRISKAAIGAAYDSTVPADIINFTYKDQVITGPTGSNNTNFDCEAFLVKDNMLHLFTKEWISPFNTTHYTLPATPGTHVATPIEVLPVNGLITDANISDTNEIVLIGYTRDNTALFMWLLFDYTGNNFFSGNKRQLSLGSALQGQIEGVAFTNDGSGYISSEYINRTVFGFPVTVPPHLYTFSVASYLPSSGTLPVELVLFEAAYTAPHVSLTWKTASEKNSATFTVERSADGFDFQEIGQQPAAGSSSVFVTYTFTDTNPASGENYYRLKQTDLDGKQHYSIVKQVTTSGRQQGLKVSPVPATKGQLLHIELQGRQDSYANVISLMATDGKVCFTKEVAGAAFLSEKLILDDLNRGVYLLRVTNSSETHSAKVLLQ